MKKRHWLIVGALVLCAGAGGYWLGECRSRSAPGKERTWEKRSPTARVTLAPVKQAKVFNVVTAFGTVLPQPGKSRSVAVLFECRVRHVLTAPGESVTNGQALAEIEPSSATALRLAEARAAVAAADRALNQTQQRLQLKLVTNLELDQAEAAAQTAHLRLRSLEEEGVESIRWLTSAITGVVGKIAVQDGQIVSAGNPLLELVAHEDIVVKLEVEAEDVVYMSEDLPLRLYPVQTEPAQPTEGRIRLITARVNPATRLVDVYASVSRGASLLLNLYVRAEIETQAHLGMLVPRSAVLPRGNGCFLYTVTEGRAVEHRVETGLQTATETEIVGSAIKPGERVVAGGNYELTNGMPVDIQEAQ